MSASETAVLGGSDRFLLSQGSFLGEVHLFLSLTCCRQNPQLAQMLCAALSVSSLGFLTRINVLISGPEDIILISLSELAYMKPLEGQNKHTTSTLLKLSPGTSEFPFCSDTKSRNNGFDNS
uniref:Uncharacterized protein n=1 Tax=Accipiter nisus TaxID=211598 RepID=A0A8B9MMV5_9AVES